MQSDREGAGAFNGRSLRLRLGAFGLKLLSINVMTCYRLLRCVELGRLGAVRRRAAAGSLDAHRADRRDYALHIPDAIERAGRANQV